VKHQGDGQRHPPGRWRALTPPLAAKPPGVG